MEYRGIRVRARPPRFAVAYRRGDNWLLHARRVVATIWSVWGGAGVPLPLDEQDQAGEEVLKLLRLHDPDMVAQHIVMRDDLAQRGPRGAGPGGRSSRSGSRRPGSSLAVVTNGACRPGTDVRGGDANWSVLLTLQGDRSVGTGLLRGEHRPARPCQRLQPRTPDRSSPTGRPGHHAGSLRRGCRRRAHGGEPDRRHRPGGAMGRRRSGATGQPGRHPDADQAGHHRHSARRVLGLGRPLPRNRSR